MHKSRPSNMKSPGKFCEKKLNSRKSLTTKNDILQRRSQPVISTTDPLEDYQPSVGLFEDKQDVEGANMFKVTPLKSKKFPKDLSSPSGKLTPQSIKVATPKVETPNQNQSYSLRQRMKRELASLNDLKLESDPEDSDENNSDYEDIESEGDEDIKSVSETSKRRKAKSAKTFPETYFNAQKQKKTATSNRTLSNLKLEQTDIDKLYSVLKLAEFHKEEQACLFRHHKSQFGKWNFFIQEGFNILLCGVGSKQKLLNAYCKEYLTDALYLIVHGFFPSITFKQILCSITEDALDYNGKFSSIQEHTEFVKKHLSEGKKELFLIIHNIDGMALRNVKTQSLLSSLAAIPNIHFLCSIDHINSPLIWDQIMLSNFKWMWFDVTNFEPYVLETSYENSVIKEQSSLLLSSLLHVYRSLTPNGQGVFMILAKHQSEEQKQGFTGIAFHEWYQECREAFFVNSEILMQTQLSEFKNHKLLTSRKSVEGADVWYIPVDNITLEQFLESCK